MMSHTRTCVCSYGTSPQRSAPRRTVELDKNIILELFSETTRAHHVHFAPSACK